MAAHGSLGKRFQGEPAFGLKDSSADPQLGFQTAESIFRARKKKKDLFYMAGILLLVLPFHPDKAGQDGPPGPVQSGPSTGHSEHVMVASGEDGSFLPSALSFCGLRCQSA